KDVISHMNDITFRQRLNQLIEPFKIYLKDNKECGNLITRIVRTRNNLTHIDAKNIKKSHENNLLELCFKMDVLLCFLIFSKLGFSSDEFQKIFQSEAIKFKLNLK
ncbi:TPA: HEPN domain-containing protein, partial [Legionella pneumophila]